MDRIQFQRRSKKKVFLLPLLVIVLLYITIPAVLINKGSKQLEKSKQIIKKDEVYAPSVEFYNGMAFLQTASSFPGFSFWTENVLSSTIKELLSHKDEKLKMLVLSKLNKNKLELKNISISKNKPQINIISNNGQQLEIELPDSLLNQIYTIYCKPWEKFFEKTKSDKSNINDICKR